MKEKEHKGGFVNVSSICTVFFSILLEWVLFKQPPSWDLTFKPPIWSCIMKSGK